MKQVLLPLMALAAFEAAALTSNPEGSPQIMSNVCSATPGRTEKCEVELDVPASCVAGVASSCPVVFFLHGAGGTNRGFAQASTVHDHGLIGVYPQGEDGWNTGPKSSNLCDWDDFECTSDPDEGAFFSAIIAELRILGANGNVYLIGNSNGAALAHRLAANAGDDLPITGIVTKVTQLLASPPRSGPGVLNHNQPPSDGPRVSVLNIMGVEDRLIPYGGGTSSVFGGVSEFQLMSSLDSMVTWVGYNGCSADPFVEVVDYTTTDSVSDEATFYTYPCSDGTILEHYAVGGAGHSFGRGATLDGVSIDYGVAFDFIDRVEEGGASGPPAPSPPQSTPSPTRGSEGCEDDPTWTGRFNTDHDCDYVSANPEIRCYWESSDGTKASEGCALSCGMCEEITTTTSSTGYSTTEIPEETTAMTTTESTEVTTSSAPPAQCEDDVTWNGKFSIAHDCDYIALNPAARCVWTSSDGKTAYDGCPKTCGECEGATSTEATTTEATTVPETTSETTTVPETTSDATTVPETTPEATTSSEVTTVPETTTGVPACVDDPSWRGKFNDSHDCAYVSLAPQFRCYWESSDGTKASEACEQACDCTSRR